MKHILPFAALLVLVTTPASAAVNLNEPITCMDLLAMCQPAKKSVQSEPLTDNQTAVALACMGYFTGFGAAGSGRVDPPRLPPDTLNHETAFCLPDNVMIGQEVLIYVAWAERNPNLLNAPASTCAYAALHEAFPCPKK